MIYSFEKPPIRFYADDEVMISPMMIKDDNGGGL